MHRFPGLRTSGLLLALALAGCSGTPFGDRLAGSFSALQAQPPTASPPPSTTPPPTTPPSTTTPSTGSTPTKPTATTPAPAGKPTATNPTPTNPTASKPGPSGATAPAAPASRAAAPQPARGAVPYRVTLRLPQADPSAPAEGLTEALRAAGVAFEVETIERLQAGGTASAPVSRPAPAPALTPP